MGILVPFEQLASADLIVDAANLVDALVANGSSDEEATGDIIVTLMGPVATQLASVPEADFVRATERMEQAADAVLADVRRVRRGASGGGRRKHAAEVEGRALDERRSRVPCG
jgi:hypothetical protein